MVSMGSDIFEGWFQAKASLFSLRPAIKSIGHRPINKSQALFWTGLDFCCLVNPNQFNFSEPKNNYNDKNLKELKV